VAESWEPFFVAQVGASAALTGLVFVALSINLSRIIGDHVLIGRPAGLSRCCSRRSCSDSCH
jgi:modulator of FtsH protease